jgi:hypothetical protein
MVPFLRSSRQSPSTSFCFIHISSQLICPLVLVLHYSCSFIFAVGCCNVYVVIHSGEVCVELSAYADVGLGSLLAPGRPSLSVQYVRYAFIFWLVSPNDSVTCQNHMRRWYMYVRVWVIGGMVLTAENWRTRGKTCPSATWSTTNLTRTGFKLLKRVYITSQPSWIHWIWWHQIIF